MRCLTRNRVPFYYALYEGRTELKDEYGNATGQYEVHYSTPRKVFGNISAARGETVRRQFGESENYDKVLLIGDVRTPIDEYSVLWVDRHPILTDDGNLALNADGTPIAPNDYAVKKVARGLTCVSIAISKVVV